MLETLYKDNKCKCYFTSEEIPFQYRYQWLLCIHNNDKTDTIYKIELDQNVLSKSLFLTNLDNNRHIIIKDGIDYFNYNSRDEQDWKQNVYWLLNEIKKHERRKR